MGLISSRNCSKRICMCTASCVLQRVRSHSNILIKLSFFMSIFHLKGSDLHLLHGIIQYIKTVSEHLLLKYSFPVDTRITVRESYPHNIFIPRQD